MLTLHVSYRLLYSINGHDFNWAYIAFKSKIYLFPYMLGIFLEFGLLYNIKFDHFCSSNTMLAKSQYVFLFTLHLFSGLK